MISQRRALSIIGGALGIFLSATTSSAVTIYAYTGQSYSSAIQLGAGPNVFDTTMSVTGNFSVANPLPANTLGFIDILADVLDFSFFNGHNTFTPINTDFAHTTFRVRTSGGQITDWDITLLTSSSIGTPFSGVLTWNAPNLSSVNPFDEGVFLSQCTLLNGHCVFGDGGDARNLNRPGTWSLVDQPAPVPIPAALPLFAGGLGLVGLIGLLARRRKRTAASFAAA